MELTKEMLERIKNALQDYPEIIDNVLIGDADGIRKLGHLSQQGMIPEDIIKLYEEGKKEEIYLKAKNIVEMKKLYSELCNLYYENNENTENKSLSKR